MHYGIGSISDKRRQLPNVRSTSHASAFWPFEGPGIECSATGLFYILCEQCDPRVYCNLWNVLFQKDEQSGGNFFTNAFSAIDKVSRTRMGPFIQPYYSQGLRRLFGYRDDPPPPQNPVLHVGHFSVISSRRAKNLHSKSLFEKL